MKALVLARENRGRQISKALKRQQIESRRYTSLPGFAKRSDRTGFDFVLADLGMPGLSSEAAIRNLKEVKQEAALVLVTSEAQPAVGAFLDSEVFLCSFDELRKRGLPAAVEARPSARKTERCEVSLARHVLVELHDPKSGRLDARRIADYLQVSLSSLAAATHRSVAGIHKSPAADSLQQVLAPIAQTISILADVLESRPHIRAWLHSPHPDLGRNTPIQLILDGHADAVADMLAAALAGQPS